MPLKITNSLTKQKETFVPLKAGEVSMYVCGPTVYDEPHIGHLRSAFVFDVMRRFLEFSGLKVKFVRNVTDVDDKIIEKAREDKGDLVASTRDVSKKYFDAYKSDLAKLGIQEPTVEPFATQHIQDMIFLAQKLIDKNIAYLSGGDVYYSVDAFASYGKLSHQKKDAMQESIRIDANERKKGPLDFALWKAAKEGEPAWDSPWGKGRPGWHIECSAMSMKYLGATFDIHGGGRDLIFPHHENEIAQSEGVTGQPFAKHWIHHGLITIQNQKMAKSLKNFVTLASCVGSDPERIEDLKFLFLKTHYSAPLDYSEQEMTMVRSVRNNFKFFFDEVKTIAVGKGKAGAPKESPALKLSFTEAMNDDFNTSLAITEMHQAMHAARLSKDEGLILAVAETIRVCFGIIGVNFNVGADKHPEIEEAIRRRNEAKKNKDYKTADAIRDEYLKKGIEFVDGAAGTTWRKR